MWQPPFYSVLLIMASVVSSWVALLWWQARITRPISGTGAMFLVCSSFWVLGNAFTLASPDLAAKITWTKLQYAGIAPLPVLWVGLVMQFTGREYFLTRRNLLLFCTVPVIFLLLAFSNEYHHLVLTSIWLEGDEPDKLLRYDNGPILLLFAVFIYSVLLWAAHFLVQSMLRSSGRIYRWRGFSLLLSMVLVTIASLLEVGNVFPELQISLTALALILTVPLLFIGLRALERTDILSVAVERVLQVMRDCVIVLDAQGRIMDLNPSALQLIGCTRSDALGKKIGEVWSDWTPAIDVMSQEQSAKAELQIGPEHDRRVFDVNNSDLHDGQGKRISRIIVLRDISKRMQVEEALRLSEAQFRALTENATDVTLISGLDGIIQYASPSLARIFGRNPTVVIGKSWTEYIHPDDTSAIINAVIESIQKPSMPGTISARFRHENGTWRTLECIATNLTDHPAVKGIVINARDVTERVEAEEKIRASLHEKEVLLKEIHHRVKNNLQIVSSLLNLQSSSIGDPFTLAQFQDSQNRVRSMALIHERLYRSDELAHIDLASYISDLTNSLLQTYRAQSHQVSLKVETEPIILDIDTAISCGLIVNELVSNALKHAFPNGRSGEIGVQLKLVGDSKCQLVVRDNGVGLSPDVDFYRTDSLGLQLVNVLTKQISGAVDCRPSPGTQISVTFPIPVLVQQAIAGVP